MSSFRAFREIFKIRQTPYVSTIVLTLLSLAASGCAIHYYDAKTGTEHLWGFGHLRMKHSIPEEGLKATITSTDTIGLGLGASRSNFFINLGWNETQLLTLTEDSNIRLEWPQNSLAYRLFSDLTTVRIGTNLPTYWTEPHVLTFPVSTNESNTTENNEN